jgi:hypothetical protein
MYITRIFCLKRSSGGYRKDLNVVPNLEDNKTGFQFIDSTTYQLETFKRDN